MEIIANSRSIYFAFFDLFDKWQLYKVSIKDRKLTFYKTVSNLHGFKKNRRLRNKKRNINNIKFLKQCKTF